MYNAGCSLPQLTMEKKTEENNYTLHKIKHKAPCKPVKQTCIRRLSLPAGGLDIIRSNSDDGPGNTMVRIRRGM